MRRLLPFAAVGIGLLAVLANLAVGNRLGRSGCEGSHARRLIGTGSFGVRPGRNTGGQGNVNVRPGAVTELDFGRGVTDGPRRIPVDLSADLPVNSELVVRPGLFARNDGTQVTSSAMTAWGW